MKEIKMKCKGAYNKG